MLDEILRDDRAAEPVPAHRPTGEENGVLAVLQAKRIAPTDLAQEITYGEELGCFANVSCPVEGAGCCHCWLLTAGSWLLLAATFWLLLLLLLLLPPPPPLLLSLLH